MALICWKIYTLWKKRRFNRVIEFEKVKDLSEEKSSLRILFPVPFSNNMHYIGDPVCTIDLIGFMKGDPTIILPFCNHLFHARCIDEWFKSRPNEKRCPNCNYSLEGYTIHL